jgi:hypothetical protein
MAVIKIIKHEQNFVILQKEIFENPEISLKAKGLWATCMAKPNDWVFYVDQMASCLKEGKDALYSGLDELIEYGYCIRITRKNEKGQFALTDYEMYETSKLNKKVPQRGFPDVDVPSVENPQLLRTDYTKDRLYKESSSEKPPLIDDDEPLRIAFKKTKKLDEAQVKRAIKYYKTHKAKIDEKTQNFPHYVAAIVLKDDDKVIIMHEKIGEIRKIWAFKNAQMNNGGGIEAQDEGIMRFEGNQAKFISYTANDKFWDKVGLPIESSLK